jgi:hypothetical protein
MQALLPHLLGHLQFLEADPTRQDQYDSMNEQTSELMKIADQLASMAEDIQMKEMEAQQQAMEQQGGQQDPQQMIAMNKIELDRLKFQNDAMIKQAKFQHQAQLQDKKTAQRMMIDRLKVAQQYGTNQL